MLSASSRTAALQFENFGLDSTELNFGFDWKHRLLLESTRSLETGKDSSPGRVGFSFERTAGCTFNIAKPEPTARLQLLLNINRNCLN